MARRERIRAAVNPDPTIVARLSSEVNRQLLRRALQAPEPAAVEELLFDPVTSLPTLPLLLRQVREVLAQGRGLGILALNLAQFSKLEEIYGWKSFDDIVRGFASCLKSVKDSAMRKEDALAELAINGNVFILLVSPPRSRRAISERDLARLRERIARKLHSYLRRRLTAGLLHKFTYFIGAAVIRKEPAVRVERLVYRAIDEALAEATSARERLLRQKARELRAILERGRISTLFQPVLDLRSRMVLGYEALSRGPRGGFHDPDVLFRLAYDTDLIWRLERVCRQRALRALAALGAEQLLFINTEPISVLDPDLLDATRVATTERCAGQVVFEITERAAIADFAMFRQAVQLLRAAGFKIAIDDVGAAYSGLRVIGELSPDFVKLDMSLTRDAHNSRVKFQLIRAIAGFCQDAERPLVVEGVETDEELRALADLGIDLVQGFLFGQLVKLPGSETVIFPDIAFAPRQPSTG